MPERERRLREGDLSAADDRRSPRKSFLIAHGFEVCFAIAGLVTALQFIIEPEVRAAVAIGDLGTFFAWFWTALYLIGSVGILVGLTRVDDRVELAGLTNFAVAAFVNAVVLLQTRGTHGVYVSVIFAAFAGGSVARIYLLLALRRLTAQIKAGSRE